MRTTPIAQNANQRGNLFGLTRHICWENVFLFSNGGKNGKEERGEDKNNGALASLPLPTKEKKTRGTTKAAS